MHADRIAQWSGSRVPGTFAEVVGALHACLTMSGTERPAKRARLEADKRRDVLAKVQDQYADGRACAGNAAALSMPGTNFNLGGGSLLHDRSIRFQIVKACTQARCVATNACARCVMRQARQSKCYK